MRKFSTGEDVLEEENFKNKTLRFTNNNFVGANKNPASTNKESNNTNKQVHNINSLEGWENDEARHTFSKIQKQGDSGMDNNED